MPVEKSVSTSTAWILRCHLIIFREIGGLLLISENQRQLQRKKIATHDPFTKNKAPNELIAPAAPQRPDRVRNARKVSAKTTILKGSNAVI